MTRSKGWMPAAAACIALAAVVAASSQIPQDLSWGVQAADPATTTEQTSVSVQPVGAAQLICPGPQQQGLENAAVPEQEQTVRVEAIHPPAEAIPGIVLEQAQGASEVAIQDVPESAETVTGTDAADRIELLIDGPQGALVKATGALSPGISTWQSHLAFTEGRRGLEVMQCGEAATEHWLIGGGGEPARLERLVLVNPSADPVTVDISVYGVDGLASSTSSQGVVVPGNDRAIVLLDAIAPGQSSPVVRVQATSGEIAAYLGDRWMDGTTGAGLETLGSAPEPALEQLIPGVVIREDAAGASLRVAVPGADSGIVTVSAFSADGQVELQQDVTVVEGEHVEDISLADLPSGTYSLQVTSDVPAVAAAQVRTAPGEDDETGLAWLSAAPEFDGALGVPVRALADGNSAWTLHMATTDADDGSISLARVAQDGVVSVEEITVPAGQPVSVEISADDQSWLFGANGGVRSMLSVRASDDTGDLIAASPLRGSTLTRGLTQVRPDLP